MGSSEMFNLNQVQVKPAMLADETQIGIFFECILTDTFKKNNIWEMQDLLQEEIEEKKRFLHEALTDHKSLRHFLIAKLNGEVIGTIAAGPANKDILEGTQNGCAGWLEIGTVFVDPAYQGKGLGKLLISELEFWLMSRGIFQYCLDSGYPKAQTTWTHHYGQPTVLLKDHWAEGADHMIWCVPLSGKKVRLWTRQDKRSLEALNREGVIRIQPEHLQEKFEEISPYILSLYDWFVEAASTKVAKPSGVSYPVWCSVSEENMLRPTENEVVYELEVDPAEVIYFDGSKWDYVLNHLYIPENEQDASRYNAQLEAKGFKHGFSLIDSKTAHLYPIEKAEVIASWHRIFTIDQWDIFKVQANLWEVRRDMVKSVLYK